LLNSGLERGLESGLFNSEIEGGLLHSGLEVGLEIGLFNSGI